MPRDSLLSREELLEAVYRVQRSVGDCSFEHWESLPHVFLTYRPCGAGSTFTAANTFVSC